MAGFSFFLPQKKVSAGTGTRMAKRKPKRNGRTLPGQSHRTKRSKVSQSRTIVKPTALPRDDCSVSSDSEGSSQSSLANGGTAGDSRETGNGEIKKCFQEYAANIGEMLKTIMERQAQQTQQTEKIELSIEKLASRVEANVRTVTAVPQPAVASSTDHFSFGKKITESFTSEKKENTIPRTVHATNNSRAATTITASAMAAVMDEADMKHALHKKNVKSDLRTKFHKYIKEHTFRTSKFPLSHKQDLKVCEDAVQAGAVELPLGVQTSVFAEQFSPMVKPRLRELRNYCQEVAKKKFISKCFVVGYMSFLRERCSTYHPSLWI